MSATTFTIGEVTFDTLSRSAGRKALYIKVSSPQHRVLKFHPPGTDGNLLIFDGRVGAKIVFVARYVGDRATMLTNFKTDYDSWVGAPIDVIDDEGTTYERCVLEVVERVGKGPIGTGGVDEGFMDVAGVISWEG